MFWVIDLQKLAQTGQNNFAQGFPSLTEGQPFCAGAIVYCSDAEVGSEICDLRRKIFVGLRAPSEVIVPALAEPECRFWLYA